MNNKILKAQQESEEECQNKAGGDCSLATDEDYLDPDLTVGELKSFLTAHTTRILKAVLEEMPKQGSVQGLSSAGGPVDNLDEAHGWNKCISAVEAPIKEAIKELEGN